MTNKELIQVQHNWDQQAHHITKQDMIDVQNGYQRFWERTQISENIGTRKNPVFIRTNIPRVKPWAGSVYAF
jgi:hypothetical protein